MGHESSTLNSSLSTEKEAGFPSEGEHRSHARIVRAAGVIGLATAASRVLGFVRDLLIAAVYGTTLPAQAFVVAFRLPNLFRDLVGEGASNSAFVPVLTRVRTVEGKESWVRLAQAVWFRVAVGAIFSSAVGVIAARWLVLAMAPGFRADPQLLDLSVRLTRILFPFIGMAAAAGFFMGLLNSVHHFLLPSVGSSVLNVCMIAGIYLWKPDALGLAWGVIAGGILQLAIQWPRIRREGVSLALRRRNHPGVAQIRTLLIPRTVGVGVYQISVLVDTIFASFPALVGSGGIAALYFAHRFLHLPLALFGISMAQAALPTMTAHAAAEDTAGIRRTCLLALRSSLFIAIPSALGLIVLGRPIIETLLERGAFTEEATRMTVSVLQWYAPGLAGLCAAKVLANTLYAFHDTWTPVKSAGTALVANVVLNALLIWPMGLAGLALATTLSSTLNGVQLYRAVRLRTGPFASDMRAWFLRTLAASLGMGAAALGIWTLGRGWIPSDSDFRAATWLLLSVAGGAGSFLLLGFLLRLEEARKTVQWLGRKIGFRIG